MIYIGKNIAGKDRFMISITGSIIIAIFAWGIGKLFMPKTFKNKKHKLEGVWFCKNENVTIRIDIKCTGYFYYDSLTNNFKSASYKGLLCEQLSDTLSLVSFNNDTLLYHTIIENSNKYLSLKSIKNSSIINFTK